MHLIAFLLFGLIVGALARFIVPGREPGGWVVSILIGIAGSMVGAFLGRGLGWYQEGQPAGFLMSLLGAILLVGAYHAIAGKRRFALATSVREAGWFWSRPSEVARDARAGYVRS